MKQFCPCSWRPVWFSLFDFLTGLLESALSTTGHAENLLTPQACVQRLVEVTQEGAKDADTMTTEVRCCLLTTEQRVCTQTQQMCVLPGTLHSNNKNNNRELTEHFWNLKALNSLKKNMQRTHNYTINSIHSSTGSVKNVHTKHTKRCVLPCILVTSIVLVKDVHANTANGVFWIAF